MPPPGRGGRGGGAGARGGSGSAPPPGGRGRGRGRGGASVTFEVPISRPHQAVHFKASNSRRGRGARKTRRGRSKGRPQSPPYQDHVAEQTPLSCSSKLLGTLKESSTTTTSSSTPQALLRDTTEISASSGRCLSSSPGPAILTLKEAENAIDRHLEGLRDEKMSKESLDKLSLMESLIQRALYWPDGKRRKCSEAFASENTPTEKDPLLQALVDKYNEDHKLFGDCAHDLKDALHSQILWESERNIWYYHLNFPTKTQVSGGIENLFFAEVKYMQVDELTVSCFCMINNDAKGFCYGCTNNGSVDMKHPSEADAYNAGRKDGYLPYGYSGEWDGSDDDVEVFSDEEDRIRNFYKGFDDPDTLRKIYAPSPHATATCIED